MTRISPAVRAALPVARAALESRASAYGITDSIVVALDAAGLLRDPETAAELVALRARAAEWDEAVPLTGLRDDLGEALVDAGGLRDTFPVVVRAQAGVLADAVLPVVRRALAAGQTAVEALAGLHPQECGAGQHRGWMADAADGPLPCPWCRIAELEETVRRAVCATRGCGSSAAYLDTTTAGRTRWVEVRVNGAPDGRWFCTTACAALDLAQGGAS